MLFWNSSCLRFEGGPKNSVVSTSHCTERGSLKLSKSCEERAEINFATSSSSKLQPRTSARGRLIEREAEALTFNQAPGFNHCVRLDI